MDGGALHGGAGFDAIVLAGGRARRLGGADKPGVDIGGSSLLDRVLAAVDYARTIVCVGPPRPSAREVLWCREDPPGCGPVAALSAGVQHVGADIVLVLAADLPAIGPAVPVLVSALSDGSADAAVLVDASAHPNYLAAAWRRAALVAALASLGDPTGVAMRTLTAQTDVLEVPDPAGWGRDCDTWNDIAAARRAEDTT